MGPETPRGRDENFFQEWWTTLRLAWKLLSDREVDLVAKLVPVLALIYVIFPIDLLPDLIPGLGQLDDVAILLMGLRFFVNLCPPGLVERYRRQLQGGGDVIDGDWRSVDSEERR